MRSRLFFAALTLVAAACDNGTDPIALNAAAPRSTLLPVQGAFLTSS